MDDDVDELVEKAEKVNDEVVRCPDQTAHTLSTTLASTARTAAGDVRIRTDTLNGQFNEEDENDGVQWQGETEDEQLDQTHNTIERGAE